MQEEESSRGERGAEDKEKIRNDDIGIIDGINDIDHIDFSDEKTREKIIKKVNIWLLKVLPMVISAMYLLHTGLSLAGMEFPPLRYLGGISLIPFTNLFAFSSM